MSSYFRIVDPYVGEKSIVGMSSIFGNRKKTVAFLYLPNKKCAICTTIVAEKPFIIKLSEKDFFAKVTELKSKSMNCIHVKEVRVANRLANILDNDNQAEVNQTLEAIRRVYFKIRKTKS